MVCQHRLIQLQGSVFFFFFLIWIQTDPNPHLRVLPCLKRDRDVASLGKWVLPWLPKLFNPDCFLLFENL